MVGSGSKQPLVETLEVCSVNKNKNSASNWDRFNSFETRNARFVFSFPGKDTIPFSFDFFKVKYCYSEEIKSRRAQTSIHREIEVENVKELCYLRT